MLGEADRARAESVRAVEVAARAGAYLQTETLVSRVRVLLALDGGAAADAVIPLIDRAGVLAWQGGARRQELGPDASVLHTREVSSGLSRWLGGRMIEIHHIGDYT
jgi:hypothetical protein